MVLMGRAAGVSAAGAASSWSCRLYLVCGVEGCQVMGLIRFSVVPQWCPIGDPPSG